MIQSFGEVNFVEPLKGLLEIIIFNKEMPLDFSKGTWDRYLT